MEINYDQLPLIAGIDGHLPGREVNIWELLLSFSDYPDIWQQIPGVEIPAENPTLSQCPEFPYFGARYPDARCIDGRLYDLDKCDEEGNLYEPSDYDPCPFCRPKEFMEEWDMIQEEFDEYMNDLKRRGYE